MNTRTGKEGLNVRHRTVTWEDSSVIYAGTVEEKGQRKERSKKVNPWFIPLLYPVCILFVVYQLVLYFDGRLPKGVTIPEAVSRKGSPVFSAERAMGHLSLLTSIGPRVVGSHENEVLAVDFLLREINWATAALAAKEKHRVTISKQQAMGWYYLAFKPHGVMNTYEGIQNIVVRLASKEPSTTSLMINCHYDSVPTSPGANDDGFHCAVMLELLRVLSEPGAPSLPHNLIFLFNGAEENPLQASHAFISQHEWAKEVRAFINLEAGGAGGKEILFQAGPGNAWLVQAYAKSVPYPHANAIGEEIFQSGLIPSDTDFRVFRDFGNIPGLDMAHAKNGYVYHTKYDDISRTSLGSMQHTGDNLMALIPSVMSAPEFVLPQNASKLSAESMENKSIFFDVMGIYMVEYSEGFGTILNLTTVLLSMVVIFGKKFGGLSGRNEKSWRIILCSAIVLSGWVMAALLVIGTAVILDTLGCHMSWFTRPALIFPLFYCPAIAGCLVPYAFSSSHSSSHQKEKADWWDKVYLDSLGVQLVWTFIIAVGTALGIRSTFIFTLMVLFPTTAHLLVALCYRFRFYPAKTWLISRHVFSLVPLMIVFYFGHWFFSLFVPISARIGSKMNPDLLIGIIAALLCIMAFSHIIPLIHVVSSPRNILASLLVIHSVAVLAVVLTPIGFPYGSKPTEPTPQRVQVLHVRSRVHSNDKVDQRNLFWMVDLDRNGAHFSLPKAVDSGCQMISSQTCEEILLCGIPVYGSRLLGLLQETHIVPAPEPVIHEPAVLKLVSQKAMSTQVRRLTFSVTGPHHVSLFLSPVRGVSLKDWTFGEVPNATYFWQNRPTYHIYHAIGVKFSQPWECWLDIEVPQGWNEKWVIDVALVAHYTHSDPAARATKIVNDTLGPVATWAHLIAWTATYDSWKF
ncbi:endoplasmic reticulum metallopeptidase 1-like [Hetaerina americana]|uniref:endoplasmic reticulum metallopeptidase 1-like n=1 Tax=Hetaerina americana TaxID=62018 RepID=UPI003A7F1978